MLKKFVYTFIFFTLTAPASGFARDVYGPFTCREALEDVMNDVRPHLDRLQVVLEAIPVAFARSNAFIDNLLAKSGLPERAREVARRLLSPLNRGLRVAWNREAGLRGPVLKKRETFDDVFASFGGPSTREIAIQLERNFPTYADRRFLQIRQILTRTAYFTEDSILPKILNPGDVAILRDGFLIGRIDRDWTPTYRAY